MIIILILIIIIISPFHIIPNKLISNGRLSFLIFSAFSVNLKTENAANFARLSSN
jgi:hypothetical protein